MDDFGRSYFITIRTGPMGAVADFGTWSLGEGTQVWDKLALGTWPAAPTEKHILDELYYCVVKCLEARV